MKLASVRLSALTSGCSLIILFLFGLVASNVALAQARDIAELAQLKGPDRLKQLIEGARREGTLNLYTSMTSSTVAKLKADFESRYPEIKVNLWRASSESVLQRATTEARANHHVADVIETNGPQMEAVQREQLLQAVDSPHFKKLIPQAVMPHREWVATRLNLFVQCYNTNKVKPDELPKTFEDLLDPRWKGRLAIEAKDSDWFMGVVDTLGEEKGVKLFRDIVAANGMSIRKGHALMAELVNAGEIPFALTCYNYKVDQDRKAGAPVAWMSAGPLVTRPNGAGVARRAPHPYAALLFYDYLISDAQALLARLDLVSVIASSDSPLHGRQVRFVDPKRALDEQAKWDKLFDEIFLAKNK